MLDRSFVYRSLLVGIAGLALLCGQAQAQVHVQVSTVEDLVRDTCAACHGPTGAGLGKDAPLPNIPRIAGQFPEYLFKQLTAFKPGGGGGPSHRASDIMGPVVEGLDSATLRGLADYYARQTPAETQPTSAEAIQRGMKIYREGNPQDNLPACISCHRERGEGIRPDFPRLAGQNPEYLEGQLKTWISTRGGRGKLMTIIVGFMKDDDMKDVAAYIATLH
ncbi:MULTISPECIES: c-type cytochrome [unclassified Beijerinckia]|uniref:c-type cytochrome n=1 Tax=unclassified Beijerinckia TaxID=2638183 RepID=UPI000894E9ED|nr:MULTISPECIES: c-type cytochrome [unclassified Beijerinckia]MDH7799057.1 cytochrome c553 [Beijerinckia sp. GAS462]SED96469.1 Cytochrome c553 [Beijerinckia sp. 28-YEA-48]